MTRAGRHLWTIRTIIAPRPSRPGKWTAAIRAGKQRHALSLVVS